MTKGTKIGDLVKTTICLIETVRYYERDRLLPAPSRSCGNYGLWGPTHVERLRGATEFTRQFLRRLPGAAKLDNLLAKLRRIRRS